MYLAFRLAVLRPGLCLHRLQHAHVVGDCRLFVLDLLHMSERSYTHAVLHVQVLTLKLTRWSANSRGSFIQILPRPPAATGVEGF